MKADTLKTTVAHRDGTCGCCGGDIFEGQTLVKVNGYGWIHDLCRFTAAANLTPA